VVIADVYTRFGVSGVQCFVEIMILPSCLVTKSSAIGRTLSIWKTVADSREYIPGPLSLSALLSPHYRSLSRFVGGIIAIGRRGDSWVPRRHVRLILTPVSRMAFMSDSLIAS